MAYMTKYAHDLKKECDNVRRKRIEMNRGLITAVRGFTDGLTEDDLAHMRLLTKDQEQSIRDVAMTWGRRRQRTTELLANKDLEESVRFILKQYFPKAVLKEVDVVADVRKVNEAEDAYLFIESDFYSKITLENYDYTLVVAFDISFSFGNDDVTHVSHVTLDAGVGVFHNHATNGPSYYKHLWAKATEDITFIRMANAWEVQGLYHDLLEVFEVPAKASRELVIQWTRK